jgi:hypothetical protein
VDILTTTRVWPPYWNTEESECLPLSVVFYLQEKCHHMDKMESMQVSAQMRLSQSSDGQLFPHISYFPDPPPLVYHLSGTWKIKFVVRPLRHWGGTAEGLKPEAADCGYQLLREGELVLLKYGRKVLTNMAAVQKISGAYSNAVQTFCKSVCSRCEIKSRRRYFLTTLCQYCYFLNTPCERC